jgi:DNA-directed RNA polymerase specialized sigma24 family protein
MVSGGRVKDELDRMEAAGTLNGLLGKLLRVCWRWLARFGFGFDDRFMAEDARQEVLLRAMTGRRYWPKHMRLDQFLYGTAKSVTNHETDKLRRELDWGVQNADDPLELGLVCRRAGIPQVKPSVAQIWPDGDDDGAGDY